MLSSLIPKEATESFSRSCEFKTLEILCDLVTRGTKVLEIGCGTGRFISIPLGYLGASIVGVDQDQANIEYAIKINPHSNVSFVCSPGENFKSSDKFDLIICNHVLEHISEPGKMLRNMKAFAERGRAGLPRYSEWLRSLRDRKFHSKNPGQGKIGQVCRRTHIAKSVEGQRKSEQSAYTILHCWKD